ncbi:MAG TPA: hypothetical protein VK619_13245 [Pyrinomonadaceae bacterium]|nr:hypothetical protein [Pyrinomonadaceae bacterium]
MNPRQHETLRRFPSRRYLLALTISLFLAALSFSCKPDANQNQGAQTGASPTPAQTPLPSPKPTVRTALEDSPIIISGGSVDVNFSDGHFVLQPGLPPDPTQVFKRDNAQIVSLSVDSTPCNVPASGEFTVFINAGGNKNDVNVVNAANFVTISLDSQAYKPNGSKKHFNGGGNLKSVTVTPKSGGSPLQCANVQKHSVIRIMTN